MGEHQVIRGRDATEVREFTRSLLDDVRALARMLEEGMFERGVRRVGAEQEMFLVDADLFPTPIAPEVLEAVDDPRVGTELARFNLEANLTPRTFGGSCLRDMESEIDQVVARVRATAATIRPGADAILTGILPTLDPSHLRIDNISPNPRYFELNEALRKTRGGDFQIHMKGLDELQMTHDNVLVEACNTSFQIHFQVAAEEFARLYNLAQVVTAPVLAAAANSPVFFGHRLWRETRIGVFQHSVDSRHEGERTRGVAPRVDFGDGWVDNSVLEIAQQDVARFRVLLTRGINEKSLEVLDRGGIPRLEALRLHNGTVYRWNRFCYGVSGGKPHLRIENRALPAGPSVVDEVANAAFYFGLMAGLAEQTTDIRTMLAFDDARSNFYAVARHGLKAQLAWYHGQTHTAESLILNELLPAARYGLEHAGIDAADIDRYLDIIEERVHFQQTGARWILDSLATMGSTGTRDLRMRTVTQGMLARQKMGAPVHRWPLASIDEAKDWRHSFLTVGQVMSTQLFTVRPADLAEMVAELMNWNHIRYVLVEDDDGNLVGLVGYRALVRLVGRANIADVAVSDIMTRDLVTVTPETPTLDAIHLVRSHQVGCLPVLRGDRLVGVLSAHDFLPLYDKLIDDLLGEDHDDAR